MNQQLPERVNDNNILDNELFNDETVRTYIYRIDEKGAKETPYLKSFDGEIPGKDQIKDDFGPGDYSVMIKKKTKDPKTNRMSWAMVKSGKVTIDPDPEPSPIYSNGINPHTNPQTIHEKNPGPTDQLYQVVQDLSRKYEDLEEAILNMHETNLKKDEDKKMAINENGDPEIGVLQKMKMMKEVLGSGFGGQTNTNSRDLLEAIKLGSKIATDNIPEAHEPEEDNQIGNIVNGVLDLINNKTPETDQGNNLEEILTSDAVQDFIGSAQGQEILKNLVKK